MDSVKITLLATFLQVNTWDHIQESKITVESAYDEQIEKELRKSVLLFPQFCLPEALRRFSRNSEGIL